MHVLPPAEQWTPPLLETSPEDGPEPNERTSLLSNKTDSTKVDVVVARDEQLRSQSAIDLLKDGHFWVLAFIAFVALGSVRPNSISRHLHVPYYYPCSVR